MSTTAISVLTGALALLLAMTGIALLTWGGERLRGVGGSLITGSALALATFTLQLQINENRQKLEAQRARQAKIDNFRLTVAVSNNLSGFDPGGNEMKEFYLGGKILDGALLDEKDMRDVVLRDARLRGAHLKGAQLRGADLLHADLSQADLTGAHLERADLRFAKFEDAAIEHAASLRGALVNGETCWPEAFLEAKETHRLVAGIHASTTSLPNGDRFPPSKGHQCRLGEHREAGPQR
jgi:uncharacterized protein YjbI with pentapeptide repeats